MDNRFIGCKQNQNTSKSFLKTKILAKSITAFTLLSSALTSMAATLTCPNANAFYPLDKSFFSSTFTQWNADNDTPYPRTLFSAKARYTSSYFLPNNPLSVTVTHDYPPGGQHRDTLQCNYNYGMVTVTYNSPNFILSDYGYDQVRTWASAGGVYSSIHTCYTTAGYPEKCSVDV